MADRIQRSRAKGWEMPEGAIYVGRPTIWGNPFVHPDPAEAVAAYRQLATKGSCNFSMSPDGLQFAANAHPNTLHWAYSEFVSLNIHKLRGRTLCCWCPIISHGQYVPCHADVLLSLANEVTIDEVVRENTRLAQGAALR